MYGLVLKLADGLKGRENYRKTCLGLVVVHLRAFITSSTVNNVELKRYKPDRYLLLLFIKKCE